MMPDHTDAEELVARALCLAVGDVWFTSETYASSDWDDERETFRGYARAALAALTEAGWREPTGGQTRPQLDDGVEVPIDGDRYTITDIAFDLTVVDYVLRVPHAVMLLRPTPPLMEVTP